MARRPRTAGATPVRELRRTAIDGCVLLTGDDIPYRDGAEDRVYELVSAASDLSSLSDELSRQAKTWAERYHLSGTRANFLRPFALPPNATVLEIGAGCGAVTRYLGETCAIVDALEPVHDRARTARARTRDLDNVAVFVGMVGDLPAQPAYDLVVVVGVLEYVGGADPASTERRRFLESIARLLRPGGSLILAIENRLGVKYIAGAPEDHSGRPFDSIDAYPGESPARTFSRSELAALLAGAGLQSTFHSAFPDYKITRTVLADALFDEAPELAWRLPDFPSPVWIGDAARSASEERLWRGLVGDGIGQHFGNSFVVTASKSDAETSLWPPDQLAAFYQPSRPAHHATETRVVKQGSGITFRRRRMREPATPSAGIELITADAPFVAGDHLLEVMESASDEEMRACLRQWRELLTEAVSEGKRCLLDLMPHNIIRRPDETLAVIDAEWSGSDLGLTELVERGALITGLKLAARTPAERWPGPAVRDAVRHVGALADLDADGGWIDGAVEREAGLQAQVGLPPGASSAERDHEIAGTHHYYREWLGRPLADLPLGTPDHLRLGAALAEREQAQEQLREAIAQRVATEAEAQALRERVAAMQSSRSWRLTAPVRALAARRRGI
jgi:SAM-dependent methyltransferase